MNIGIDLIALSKLGIGPVLFREESVFIGRVTFVTTTDSQHQTSHKFEIVFDWT